MSDKSLHQPHIVWIYTGSLSRAMDAATWLRTVEEMRNSGWNVTLIAVGPDGYRQIRGVEVLCISRPEIYLLRQVVYHLRVISFIVRRLASTDLVLFHESSAPWVSLLWLLRWLTGRRKPLLVMDTRTLPMPQLDKGTKKEKLREKAYGYMSRLGTRCADGRLAITRRMADAVHIPAEKFWGTWPSGADVEHFSLARLGRNWPLPDDPVKLVYHGSMHYERNLMALCRAVAQANAEGMLFELSLIGDGTERAELENFAEQTNGSVRVIRPVQYANIPQKLAQSHIGALPFPDEDKFRVSSPIKLFEYMAAGLPILATRIACHTDVIGSDEYAFWANDAGEQTLLDTLRVVWQSRDLLSDMGQHAASAAQAWTWKGSANKLRKALEVGIELSNRKDIYVNKGKSF